MRKASPVDVMSAAGPKDDPMDLGPFLKEYVLNNPFTSNSSPSPPRPLPMVTIKSRPLVVASPPALVSSRNHNCSPVLPVQHVTHVPILAVKALPIVAPPVVQQVAPLLHHGSTTALPGGASGTAAVNLSPKAGRSKTCHNELEARREQREREQGERERERERQIECPREEKIEIGGVVDTPKAHIGSNKNFAMMLREMKLPHKHTKVKKWLLANYRHVPNSPEWLSSEDLIDHANTLFADLKSSVLSRIMKVTFPNCHKVINKYGYFYIGLVRKPEAKHYTDELLRMATKTVVDGRFSSDHASKLHGVSSQLVNRMVAWYDTIDDPVVEESLVMSDTGSDETEEELPEGRPPQTNLKWKLRQRARSRLLSKIKLSSQQDNKSGDETWEPPGRARPYNTRSPRKRQRKHSNEELLENGNGKADEVNVKQENVSEEDEDEEDDEEEYRMDVDGAGSSTSDVTATTGSPLPVIAAIGSLEVHVKEEPADTGYDQYEHNNNNVDHNSDKSPEGSKEQKDSPISESFNTLRTLLKEKTTIAGPGKASESGKNKTTQDGSMGQVSGPAGGRPQSLNSVVDLLTMKQELQRTKEELREKEDKNIELEKKLGEAHVVIGDLKKNLSSQETKLMNLAAEFFELSNRFMKVTHKFKQALSEPNIGQERG